MGFVTETNIKAVRKRHRCDACRKHVEIGDPAIRWAGTTDGDFSTATYHPDCRAAETALNDIMGFQYGDEWCGLGDIEDEDRPWLLETFPAVAARMGLAAAQPGETGR